MEFWLATAMMNDLAEFPEVARAAEAAGFTGVAVADHVVMPEQIESKYPYSDAGEFPYREIAWPDPWVAIGAMAGATSTLQFTTNIYILPLRNPFVVAKQISTASAISGDRVSVGFGAGWMKEEFDLLEQRFSRRGARMEEMIEILRKLWSADGPVEHHGEFYDFAPLTMNPVPARPVPIYIGGATDLAIRRATTLGDGWIGLYYTTDEVWDEIARIKAGLDAAGRSIDDFHIGLSVIGSPEPELVASLADAGVNALFTIPWLMEGNFAPSLDEKCASLENYGKQFVAPLG